MSAELNAEIVTPTDNLADTSLIENTDEKSEQKSANVPNEATEEVEKKSTTEKNENVTTDETREQNERSEQTDEIMAPASESVVASNNETEEKRDTGEEGEVNEVVAEDEGKNNKEPPADQTVIEKQDGEEAKKENELPERQQDEASSLGEFETFLAEDKDSGSVSFELAEGEDEKQEQLSQTTTITVVSDMVPEKKKKKRSKKKYDQGSQDTIVTLQLGIAPPIISGDFAPLGIRKPSLETISTVAGTPSAVEEESDEEEDEEQPVILKYSRKQYYDMYNKLDQQYEAEKLKNDYFVKKLVNYYTHRKMFHVLHEGKLQLDASKKYEKQLDNFERSTTKIITEQMKLEEDIRNLEIKCDQKENETQKCFEKFQHAEHEVGKEIMGSESADGHEKKVIEYYLKRQRNELKILKKIRLDYIRVRNKVTETQETLDAIDNLGPNLRLIDYEQLKIDNRNLLDKLEEKELELTKVRIRCQNAVQILAHQREKGSALEGDLYVLTDTLTNLTGEYDDVREQLNAIKQERDLYRSDITQILKQSGLLGKPKLLQNMCQIIEESVDLADQLLEVRNACITITQKVEILRKNMSSKAKLKKIENKMKLEKINNVMSKTSITTL